MPTPEDYHLALGRNVRELRTQRGWSLEQLSLRSGLSRAMIVQIEGVRTNASIGTICKLAEAFAVPVPTLLALTDPKRLRVIRHGDGIPLWTDGKSSWARVLEGALSADVEFWDWRLAPGASYSAPAHARGIREKLFVHRGSLRLRLGDEEAIASAGELIVFEANRPHHYENPNPRVCLFKMTLLLPVADVVTCDDLRGQRGLNAKAGRLVRRAAAIR